MGAFEQAWGLLKSDLPGHKPGCDLGLNGFYPHYSERKYRGECTCKQMCVNCESKEKWGYPHNDTDLCFDCTEDMAGKGLIDSPFMNWMSSQEGGSQPPKTDDEDWQSDIETGEPMEIAMRLLKMKREKSKSVQTTLTGERAYPKYGLSQWVGDWTQRAPKQHTGLNYYVSVPKQDLADRHAQRRYAIRRKDTNEIVGSLPMNPQVNPDGGPARDYQPPMSRVEEEHQGQNLYARALMGILSAGKIGVPALISNERNALSEGAHRALMDKYSRQPGSNLESLTGYSPVEGADGVRYNQLFNDGYGSLRSTDPGGLPVRAFDLPRKRYGPDYAQTDLEDFGLEP